MTDLSVTAANVLAGPNARIEYGYAGAAVTAGQTVYVDVATRRFMLADSNSATLPARGVFGFALNNAAPGQPLAVHRSGDLTIGATLTPGSTYYLSETPGGIQPAADLATGENVVLLGIARTASVLAVNIQISGVTL